MVADETSASDIEAKHMLWSKVIYFVVMTVAVSSQMANAEIAGKTSMANARSVDINSNSPHPGINAPNSDMSSGADVSADFLLRDAGLRSLASYAYRPHAADEMDSWLMLLVGGGLVVLQLRRKQKTLPQRPLIETENKLFWG